MKLLIVGDIGIIFTYEYVTEIASKFPNCTVDVLSFAPLKEANAQREQHLAELGCRVFYPPQYTLFKKNKLLHVFIRLAEAIRYRICRNYDIVNIHFPGADSLAVCHWVSAGCRIVTSLYGSDVLRASKRGLGVIGKLLARSDAVTVASRYIKDQVSEKYQGRFDDKLELVRYGAKAAAFMSEAIAGTTKAECKEAFGFPQDRITVLCGYNGSRQQRHLEILEQLGKLPQSLQEKLFLVFQCSYGYNETYAAELSASLTASPLSGEIVTEFMQGERLAKFRNSIDVFLNLQPTDVLSATMIEELEAGAIVVKGDWLSYPDLEERNAYLRSVADMNALSGEVEGIIANYPAEQEKARGNKGIWEILSWEKQYKKWESVVLFPAEDE